MRESARLRVPRGEHLHYKSLADTARLLRTKAISPVELTQHMLDRMAAVDGNFKSYVTVMPDRALAAARRAEAEIQADRYRGPLHGMAIGVKDLCYTRGVATAAGTKILSDFVPDFDATVVVKLQDAGAVILGKQTLCEGAFGPYHPELEVPVNPWNPSRWSGVSSSGSAVAAAAGLCFGSLGTDTGGSIRYPTAANGCVGLKPTYGRVSRHGVFPLAESMDHVGPMTRTVQDAAILFDCIAGHDVNDPTSLRSAVEAVQPQLARGIRGLRVGFDPRYGTEKVEEETAVAIGRVLEELAKLGATIVSVNVTLPDASRVDDAWNALCLSEAATAHAKYYPGRANEYGPGFRAQLESGSRVSGAEIASALKVRLEVAEQINRLLEGIDCLVSPSMSNAAREKEADPTIETDESWRRLVTNDIFAKPFNFSGSPTLSMPCGFTADGMPLSVQFVGRALSEAILCRIGYAYEQVTEWHTRHPSL